MTAKTTPPTREEQLEEGFTHIAVRCVLCNTAYYLKLPLDGVKRRKEGMLMQDAFPTLDAADRELMISRTCGPCFDTIFSQEEE